MNAEDAIAQGLTPEGLLLERARQRGGLSQNEAARQAGMTGTHWRSIVKGKVSMTSERGAATMARMAQVVGLTRDDWLAIERPDVADLLPGSESFDEVMAEAEQLLDRLRATLDARLGERRKRQRDAAIDIIRAEIEESTSRKPPP